MAMGNHVSAFQTGRVSMSNRQYTMLRTIAAAPRSTVPCSEIMGWHQTTMGGCKRRNFICETEDKHGVRLTTIGRQALASYETADFYRRHSSLHFAVCLHLEPPANLLASLEKMKHSDPAAKSAGRSGGRHQAHAA